MTPPGPATLPRLGSCAKVSAGGKIRGGGGRRWVPVSTGTTGAGGRTHIRHSRDGGNPRRGAGDGFPSPRERRAPAGAPTIVIPAPAGIRGGGPAMGSRLHGNDGRRRAHPQSLFPRRRESTAGGRRWVPVSTGTTGAGGRTHIRHSRDGGNPRGGPAMGSRLHGNDGRRRAHPQSLFPRRRESAAGGRRWVRPSIPHGNASGGRHRFPPRERRAPAGAPTIVRGRQKHSSPQL